MAKRSSAPETNDSDRIEGFAHPRERFEFLGQEVVLGRAARALRAGRPPSAWLITGAPGTGKATLAYRIARYLLAYGASDAGAEDLSVPQEHPASRQVMAQSHPGLLVLKRALNPKTGKLMTVLPVDEIRRLADFFGMTSGAGGWRVAIVDTADDMNDNAANALLKMLEEPPGRAMLLLLSNTPGRLLPTIRSRCQRLDLRPLDNATLEKALATELPGISAAERASLARLSGGSIGAALTLATGDGAALAQEADRLIDQARDPDLLALLALGEKLFRMRDGLEMFGGFLRESLSDRIRARAHDGAAGLERWVALLGRIEQGLARATGLHLEPRQVVLTTARDLSRVARSGGL
ncbi:MAG TPA: DNA polymerase III subunit delta' [Rhizomicrobium sp.]|nr:DNA polymerase III subunit delta' [Rhizomicrobium sp.]